ncbi:hypothetical protein [uncultured Sneathiella sp.]|jgi:hypothetical protein|tara:strand:+ start:1124 stop:1255 length:132 start_codon:yes stop_codon:yes gene_type:complete
MPIELQKILPAERLMEMTKKGYWQEPLVTDYLDEWCCHVWMAL